MTSIYSNNPYYNLLVYFLIKYRLCNVSFYKNLFDKLNKEAQQELENILIRNRRLTLLEQHKTGFSDKKSFDAGEYYRLENLNAKLLDVELEPPTLVDLSARTLCVYAFKRGLFDRTRVEIDEKTKQIGILVEKQPWYSNPFFGKKYAKSPQRVPDELFEKITTQSKITFEKIEAKYFKLNNSYFIKDHFNFDERYIDSIVNFLLWGTINKDNNDGMKMITGNNIFPKSVQGLTALDIA